MTELKTPLLPSEEMEDLNKKPKIDILSESFIDQKIQFSKEEEKIQTYDELVNENNKDQKENIVNKGKISRIHKATELSPDCSIGPDAAPSELLTDILKVEINQTLSDKLTVQKSCFQNLSVEKIMSWQKKEIKEPLLIMDDGLKPISIQMFRNILSYMTDRKSSKRSILHARKVLKMTINEPQIIKDEAYLQAFKQIRNNPRYDSLIKGWKLLAILASVYVPSPEIYNLILNFLFFEIQNNGDPSIVNHGNYIFVRMLKTKESPRLYVPCFEELEYIEYLKPIPIPLYFFNGSQTNVNIESYTTIKKLKEKMMKSLEFNQARALYYSIYEICNRSSMTEERFIDDNEKVCDVISLWKNDREKALKKKEHIDFKLYLKLFIFYPFDDDDYDTISVVFYQTVYDVVSGKFSLTKDQIMLLGALQLLNEFGNDFESAFSSVKKHLVKYVPEAGVKMLTKDQWTESIMQIYETISHYSKQDAKIIYLKELEKNPTFRAHQFDAKFNYDKSGTNDDHIPENCIIAIKPESILILDRDRKEIVNYPYDIIVNWGISKDQFIINISKDEQETLKVCFITLQTKVMQSLLVIYCNLLTGKTFKDVNSILEADSSKVKTIEHTRARGASKFKKAESYKEELDNENVISTSNAENEDINIKISV